MIKSRIIEKDKLKFPKLMLCKMEGTIVLMYSKTSGIVVGNTGDCQSEIGYYSEFWDTNCFEDFDGTVELSNEK